MLQTLRYVDLVLELSLRNAFRNVVPKLFCVLGEDSKDEEAIDLDLPVDDETHVIDRSRLAIIPGDGSTRLGRVVYIDDMDGQRQEETYNDACIGGGIG